MIGRPAGLPVNSFFLEARTGFRIKIVSVRPAAPQPALGAGSILRVAIADSPNHPRRGSMVMGGWIRERMPCAKCKIYTNSHN
jgi:hypothetical protein